MWILGDYLVTGYGFSDERDYLFVLNKWTGAVVQKLPLPKAPGDFIVHDRELFVWSGGYVTVYPILIPIRPSQSPNSLAPGPAGPG